MSRLSALHGTTATFLLGAALATWLLARPRANAVPPLPEAATSALDAGVDALDASTQDPNTATVVFVTVPNVTATVFWGRKLLGKILPGKPLVVVRPRDSGPLDVIVRTAGYMPVQTRAHTFSDTRVLVKLTPPDKKTELLGYRIPIDAGADGGEGGVAWPPALEAGVSSTWDGGVPFVPTPAPAPLAPPPL
jgi:hypothetical protein